MNKQYKNPDSRGISWTDYTWNPIGGCLHGCAWEMPDGKVANCYAEDVADRLARSAYPQGFEHHYWHPEQLNEPFKLKEPSRIFVGSMADVFGHWVPDAQIEAVLDVCRRTPHTYQFLTKNAPRYEKFNFPSNCWLGVSAPPTYFMGKPLNTFSRRALVDKQKTVFLNLNRPFDNEKDMMVHRDPSLVRWMSIEPLSFDIAPWLEMRDGQPPLDWVVIGAASNGATVYQPEPEWVSNLLNLMDRWNIPVFFKENLRGNKAASPWREHFPEVQPEPIQMSLF